MIAQKNTTTKPLNQNKMKPQNQFIETLITILGTIAIVWLVLTLINL